MTDATIETLANVARQVASILANSADWCADDFGSIAEVLRDAGLLVQCPACFSAKRPGAVCAICGERNA